MPVNYGFDPTSILYGASRKRKANELIDPTTGLPYDMSVPTDLPMSNNPVIPQAGTGKEGRNAMLANIFNAIASGVAVFGSDKPGEMLMQQLMQRRQEGMQREQMEYERENRSAQERFQREMKDKDIKARQTEQAVDNTVKKELQQSAQAHDIALSSQEFANRKDLQAEHAKAEAAAEKLKEEFQINLLLPTQNKLASDLKKLGDAGDLQQIKIKTVMSALLSASKYHSMVPIGAVLNIIDKMEKGIALTKADETVIDKARAANLREIASAGRGTGRGIVGDKFNTDKKGYLDLVKTRNDLIQHLSSNSRETAVLDMDGKPRINFATGQAYTMKQEVDSAKMKEILDRFDEATGFQEIKASYMNGQVNTNTGQQKPQRQTNSDQQVLQNLQGFTEKPDVNFDELLKQTETQLQTNPYLLAEAKKLIAKEREKRRKATGKSLMERQ